jgi:hypothetical protein
VNPCEWLYTPTDDAYHFNDEQVDEISQGEELPTSFFVEPSAALDSLVGDGTDVPAARHSIPTGATTAITATTTIAVMDAPYRTCFS